MAKLTFNEASNQINNLMRDIQAGKFAPIYVLMGDDSFHIDMLTKKIIDTALTPMEKEFNQTIIYGKDTTGGEVVAQCRRYPMMSQRQLVVVKEASAMAKMDELVQYITKPLATTVLVMAFKHKPIDKRSALYKAMVKTALIVETVELKDNEVPGFVEILVRQKGYTIDPKAVAMVTDYVGGDIEKITSQFEKLFIRLANPMPITPTHIEENFGISKDFNAFELNKALSARNFSLALRIADSLTRNPKENPMQMIIALIFSSFQKIVATGIILWQAKRDKQPIPSKADVAKKVGVSPYFVDEYISAANSYTTKRAFEVIALLRKYDMRTKGVGAAASDAELLKELIINIAML